MKLDYLLHFVAGFVITLFSTLVLSILSYNYLFIICFSILTLLLVALFKELYDKYVKLTRFDFYDFIYTIFGGIVGLIISLIYL